MATIRSIGELQREAESILRKGAFVFVDHLEVKSGKVYVGRKYDGLDALVIVLARRPESESRGNSGAGV